MSRALNDSSRSLMSILEEKEGWHYPSHIPQVVRGSYFDMGYEQGRMNSLRIQKWLSLIFSDERLGFFKLLKWPMRLGLPFMSATLSSSWIPILQRYMPEILERMEGIAKGSGCSLGEILYQHSIEILGGYPLHSGGCSTMYLSSSYYEDNEPVIAKNFDYMPFLKHFQIVRESHPDRGYAAIEITAMPLAGSHAGVNECGLVVVYNYSYSIDKNQRGLPLSLFVQHLLQTCSSIEEAGKKIGRVPWIPSGLLLLGDAQGRFLKVEMSHSHFSTRVLTDEWNVFTNHFIDPEIMRYALSSEAIFPKFMPPPWRGTRIRESSEMRYDVLSSFLRKRRRISLQEIQAILRDHGSSGVGSNNTVCRHSRISSTISSLIFFPASLRLICCNKAPCSGNFHTFHLRI